jgi:cytochrome c oxidase subunit 2
VKSKDDYAAWRDEQKKKLGAGKEDANKVWDVAELVARGHTVFDANCAACHQAGGTGNPAIGAPPLVNDKVVLGPKAHQVDVVLNGQNNGKMPPWKDVLSDTDIAAVVTYTRNSWGNKAEQNLVQPAEVKAERK